MALSIATLKSILKNFCDTRLGSWYEIRAWYSEHGLMSATVAWSGFEGVNIADAQKQIWEYLGLNLDVDGRQDISRIECGGESFSSNVADQLDPNPILSHAVDPKDLKIKELEDKLRQKESVGPRKEPAMPLEIKDERVDRSRSFGVLKTGDLFYHESRLFMKIFQAPDQPRALLLASPDIGKVADLACTVIVYPVRFARLTILE
jgi:hypothetical protein